MNPTVKPPVLTSLPGLTVSGPATAVAPEVTAVRKSGHLDALATAPGLDQFALAPHDNLGADLNIRAPDAGRFASTVPTTVSPLGPRSDVQLFFTYSSLERLARDYSAQIHQSWMLGQNELSLSLPRSHVPVATTEAAEAFLQQLLGGDFTLFEVLGAFDPLVSEVTVKLNFMPLIDDFGDPVWRFSAQYFYKGESCGSYQMELQPSENEDGLVSGVGDMSIPDKTPSGRCSVPAGIGRRTVTHALTFAYRQTHILRYCVSAQEVGTYAWRLSPLPFSEEQADLIVQELKAFNKEHALALTDAQIEAVRSPYDVTQLLVLKKPQPDFIEILKDSEFKDSGFKWTREQRNDIARRPGVLFLLQRGQYSFGWDETYKATHPQIEVFRTP